MSCAAKRQSDITLVRAPHSLCPASPLATMTSFSCALYIPLAILHTKQTRRYQNPFTTHGYSLPGASVVYRLCPCALNDAFGDIGTISRELEWKTPIFPRRAAPTLQMHRRYEAYLPTLRQFEALAEQSARDGAHPRGVATLPLRFPPRLVSNCFDSTSSNTL